MTIEELFAELVRRDCYLIAQPTTTGSIGVELSLVRTRTDRDGKRRYAKTVIREPSKTAQAMTALLDGDLDQRFPKME